MVRGVPPLTRMAGRHLVSAIAVILPWGSSGEREYCRQADISCEWIAPDE